MSDRPTTTTEQIFGPVLVPTGAPDLPWSPSYPDFARAVVITTAVIAATTSFAYTPDVAEIDAQNLRLSWSPTYPDRLPDWRQKLSVYSTAQGAHEAPQIVTAWLPRYPDQVDPRLGLHAAEQRAFFMDLEPGDLASEAEELGWLPVLQPLPKPKVRIVPFAAATGRLQAPRPLDVSLAIYPDTIAPRAGLHASQQRAFFFDPEPIAAFDPAELGWTPTYDANPVLPIEARYTYPSWVGPGIEALADLSAEQLGWTPRVEADPIRPLEYRYLLPSTFFVGEPSDLPPEAEELGWLPVYDTDPVQPVEYRYTLPSTFFIGEPTDLPPEAEELGWQPEYLDVVRPVEYRYTLPSIFLPGIEAVADPVAERLAWLPREEANPVLRLADRYKHPSVFFVGEPADVPPTAEELAWTPELPDFARRLDPHPAQFPSVFYRGEPSNFGFEDLSWEPEYPSRLPQWDRRPHAAQAPYLFRDEGEPPAAFDPAQIGRVVYPDLLPQWTTQPHPSGTPSVFYQGNPADFDTTAEELGWAPELPDFARGVGIHASRIPSTFFVGEPGDLAPEAEELGWLPVLQPLPKPKVRIVPFAAATGRLQAPRPLDWLTVYPALIDPPQGLHASRAPFFFAPDREPVAVFDPAQIGRVVYPDALPQWTRQPHAAYAPYVFFVGEPSDVPPVAEEMGWRPELPDFALGRATHSSQMPSVFFVGDPADFGFEDLSWAPQYPDRIDPTPGLAPHLHPASFLDPLPQQPEAEFNWRGVYPGQIDRREPHPSQMPSVFVPGLWVPTQDVPGSWYPVYPGLIDPTPGTHASAQDWFFSPEQEPEEIPEDQLAWRSVYPDAIDRVEVHPAQLPYLFYQRLPETDELAWRPIYPDAVDRTPSRHYAPSVFFVGEPSDVPPTGEELGWQPRYPDQVDRVETHAARMPSVFFGGDPSVFAVPDLSWQPRYPDGVDRLVVRAADQQAFFGTLDPSVFPVPDLAWTPVYPDAIDRLALLADQQRAFFFDPLPTVAVDEFGWRGVYPDAVDRLEVHASQQDWLFYETALPQLPIPDLSWIPVYPDQIDPRVSVITATQRPFFFDTDPIPPPPRPIKPPVLEHECPPTAEEGTRVANFVD